MVLRVSVVIDRSIYHHTKKERSGAGLDSCSRLPKGNKSLLNEIFARLSVVTATEEETKKVVVEPVEEFLEGLLVSLAYRIDEFCARKGKQYEKKGKQEDGG